MNEHLIPAPGYALVRVRGQYKSGLSFEKEKYSTNTRGTLIGVNFRSDDDEESRKLLDYLGDLVFFDGFQDGEAIKEDDGEYIFVPVKEIRGVKTDA